MGSTLVLVAAVATMALAGCGGGESTSTSTSGQGEGGSTSASTSGDEAELSQARQEVAALVKGTYGTPPKAPKPEPGKEILVISCGQAISTCSEDVTGAEEAAQKMGWKTQVFDTKGDPSQAAAGIRQAIVAKDDGVLVELVDCRYIKEALREAKEHDLPVMATESLDCNFRDPSGEALFAGTMQYVDGEYADWIKAYGEGQANFLIAETDGEAKVIAFVQDGVMGAEIQQEALKKTLEKCPGCEDIEVPFTFADLETGLQEKTEQALLQHPEANAVYVPYDGVLLSGVSNGVKAAGRPITVAAAEGNAATIDLVREGVVTGGIGIPMPWDGWAGMDGLNRLFHGVPIASSGVGHQIYDKEHNLPASGPYQPPVDFRAAYEKAWGLK